MYVESTMLIGTHFETTISENWKRVSIKKKNFQDKNTNSEFTDNMLQDYTISFEKNHE